MRRMSFALTKEQVQNQTKTVTRRNGWNNLKVGDLIQTVEKCMGLKKGEKQVKIGCPIRVTAISVQRLYQITKKECELEGFPHLFPEDFIVMYCQANKCKRDQRINRIEYEYTDPI